MKASLQTFFVGLLLLAHFLCVHPGKSQAFTVEYDLIPSGPSGGFGWSEFPGYQGLWLYPGFFGSFDFLFLDVSMTIDTTTGEGSIWGEIENVRNVFYQEKWNLSIELDGLHMDPAFQASELYQTEGPYDEIFRELLENGEDHQVRFYWDEFYLEIDPQDPHPVYPGPREWVGAKMDHPGPAQLLFAFGLVYFDAWYAPVNGLEGSMGDTKVFGVAPGQGPEVIPEPATLSLLGFSALFAFFQRRLKINQ